MTQVVFNSTQTLDTISESQMAELAARMNAIEPGAGSADYNVFAGMEQLGLLGGFELLMLACVLCTAIALSTPYGMKHARHVWGMLRKA